MQIRRYHYAHHIFKSLNSGIQHLCFRRFWRILDEPSCGRTGAVAYLFGYKICKEHAADDRRFFNQSFQFGKLKFSPCASFKRRAGRKIRNGTRNNCLLCAKQRKRPPRRFAYCGQPAQHISSSRQSACRANHKTWRSNPNQSACGTCRNRISR